MHVESFCSHSFLFCAATKANRHTTIQYYRKRMTLASSVFASAVKKLKNENIQDGNFACGSVWV
jgi:hypothetical protein